MRIQQFYERDPRRRASDEVKFGDDWRLAGEKGSWSVFWLRDTGELAAYQTGWSSNSGSSMTILGDVVSEAVEIAAACRDEVAILLVDADEASLRATLSGWQEHVDLSDGFAWMLGVAAKMRPEPSDPGATST